MEEKKTKQIGGDHYLKCGIMPTTYIRANNLDFFEGNIIKYATRHKEKGGAEDIKKVIHYAEMILEDVYGYKNGQPPVNPYKDSEDTAWVNELSEEMDVWQRPALLKKGLTNKQIDDILGK